MDVSYPLHRYSALVKDLGRFAGGADYRLDAGQGMSHRPDQPPVALRDELRGYFAGLLHPGAGRAAHRTARRRLPGGGPADGPRRLARGGLAHRVRRPRAGPGRAADLRQRGGPGRHAAAAVTLQTVGPTLQAHGTRSRRTSSSPGYWPARCTSRSGTPSRTPAPTSPRCAPRRCGCRGRGIPGQRAEDLHHRGPRGPTTCGWPAGPTRTRPGTGGSPSSSWTPPIPASRGRRSLPTTGRITSTRATTAAYGSRSACGSARRTRAGGW